jgi:uncharacterized membrane protein YhaH (DUF805 family)
MTNTRSDLRSTFFVAVLIAAVASTPLAAGAVIAHWTGVGASLLPWGKPEAAGDLVLTFVNSFTVLVLTGWMPCAIVLSRLRDADIRGIHASTRRV